MKVQMIRISTHCFCLLVNHADRNVNNKYKINIGYYTFTLSQTMMTHRIQNLM